MKEDSSPSQSNQNELPISIPGYMVPSVLASVVRKEAALLATSYLVIDTAQDLMKRPT